MPTARAYGKINLSLEITARRPDGYHELATVMQSVSLHDVVTLEKASDGPRIVCGAGIPADASNTAYRAVEAFAAYCRREDYRCVSVTIEKHLPSQAGMGGGSADAAATLVLLNRVFAAGLSTAELCAIGKTVGADVPFCVAGGTQLCRGIGEICSPLPAMPACTLLICKPPQGISTKEAFARADKGNYADGSATLRMEKVLCAGDLSAVAAQLQNDFERLMPLASTEEIREIMLRSGALGARMTGSGSVVYGVFSSKEEAQAAGEKLAGKGDVFCAEPAPQGVEIL